MKQVVFYDYTSGKQQILGKVLCNEKEKITFEGLSGTLLEEMQSGVRDKTDNTQVTPASGLKFLRALPLYYCGSMLTASLVQEL